MDKKQVEDKFKIKIEETPSFFDDDDDCCVRVKLECGHHKNSKVKTVLKRKQRCLICDPIIKKTAEEKEAAKKAKEEQKALKKEESEKRKQEKLVKKEEREKRKQEKLVKKGSSIGGSSVFNKKSPVSQEGEEAQRLGVTPELLRAFDISERGINDLLQ